MFKVLLIVLIVCINVSSVWSECCTPPWRFQLGYFSHDTACGDSKYGERCCGRGACNMFCCNCDGGCRHSSDEDFHQRINPGDIIACKMNQFAEHILLAVDKDNLAESNGGSRENHSATIKIRNWRDAIRGYAKFDQTLNKKKPFI